VSQPQDWSGSFDRIEQMLDFPVEFPLKVMGLRMEGFAQAITDLVAQHVPGFDAAGVQLRASSKGTWLSVTVTPQVHSREQLERLYRALCAHPMVRYVL
jgi:uncharacterized protein